VNAFKSFFLYKISWPIIALLFFFALLYLIVLWDRRSLNRLVQKQQSNSCTSSELLKDYKDYLKHHPLFPDSTNLIVAILPIFAAEKESPLKWIKKINSKDLNDRYLNMVLYDYFILLENGLTDEIEFFKKKTVKKYAENKTFNLFYNMYFCGELPTTEVIETLDENTLKGIAYYYNFVSALKTGDNEKAILMKKYAMEFGPRDIMQQLIDEREKR